MDKMDVKEFEGIVNGWIMICGMTFWCIFLAASIIMCMTTCMKDYYCIEGTLINLNPKDTMYKNLNYRCIVNDTVISPNYNYTTEYYEKYDLAIKLYISLSFYLVFAVVVGFFGGFCTRDKSNDYIFREYKYGGRNSDIKLAKLTKEQQAKIDASSTVANA